MHNVTVNLLRAVAICAATLLPTQVFAYTCTVNPAICIAICGSKTCEKIGARDSDVRGLESSSAGQVANSTVSAKRKPYTCSNPAICIAVCGKKTC
jgi:hypothetical protein